MRIDASTGQTEGGAMRGFHCVDPSHARIEFTGADDEDLFQNVKKHTTTAHPQLSDGQIRDMIAGADWWKEVATSGVNAGSSPSAYDK
jgi:hypothetical protein